MVSIRDVAKHAGVAISTVSKVVNNYPNVSEKTREKVNNAIRELDFIPNTIASALSSKQAGRVALLLNLNTHVQPIDEISMQYVYGAINQCRERNLDAVTLFHSMLLDKTTGEMEQYFRSQSISGIIIYGMSRHDKKLIELIDRQQFKIVTVDTPFVNDNASSVWIDQKQAQKDVARKTIQENKGKRILYIRGRRDGFVTEGRLQGMKELAEELKLTLKVVDGDFSELKARELTFKFAKRNDMVICASDLMAIGAMKALIEMDIFRPVCGFDGITLMGYAGKQMNTVQQNFSNISKTAVEELARLMAGETGRNVILPHEIVRLKYEDIIR